MKNESALCFRPRVRLRQSVAAALPPRPALSLLACGCGSTHHILAATDLRQNVVTLDVIVKASASALRAPPQHRVKWRVQSTPLRDVPAARESGDLLRKTYMKRKAGRQAGRRARARTHTRAHAHARTRTHAHTQRARERERQRKREAERGSQESAARTGRGRSCPRRRAWAAGLERN